MNIQDARLALAETLDDITEDGWTTSTDTKPDIYTGLIHVGHVQSVKADTYATYGCDIPITLWADEATDVDAVSKLYALISPMDGSILRWLQSKASPVTAYEVGPVERREEGPGAWLAVDITVRLQISSTP